MTMTKFSSQKTSASSKAVRARTHHVVQYAFWTAASVFLLSTLGACDVPFFPFERTPDLPRGSITGQVMRGDVPAAFAGIVVQGAGKIVTADSEGRFRINGLGKGRWSLRVLDDEDNDGIVDSSMIRTFLIEDVDVLAAVPILKQDISEPNTLYLGELQLITSEMTSGTVRIGLDLPSASNTNVKVYATREVNYYEDDSPQSFAFSFGAEAVAHVDAQGNFQFNSVLFQDSPPSSGGPLYAVAVQFSDDNPAASEVLAVSEPMLMQSGSTFDLVVPSTGQLPTRGVLHTLNSELLTGLAVVDYNAYILLQIPGSGAFPPCEIDGRPDVADLVDRFPAVRFTQTHLGEQGELPLPLGVWDVQLCITTGERTYQGILSQQVLGPAVGGAAAPLWGPYAMTPVDRICQPRCLVTADDDTCVEDSPLLPDGEGFRTYRDCDDDGSRGMPVSKNTDVTLVAAIRSICAQQCGSTLNALDAAGSPQRCTIETLNPADFGLDANNEATNPNGEYDCDDDGDGQPDFTEAEDCYGPGLGTDLDGDGLCSGLDAFPECAANEATICVAGTFDLDLKEADGVVKSFVNTNFGDAGQSTLSIGGSQLVIDATTVRDVNGVERIVMFGEDIVEGGDLHLAKWETSFEGSFTTGNQLISDPASAPNGEGLIQTFRFEDDGKALPAYKTMGVAAYDDKIFVAYTRNIDGEPRAYLMMIGADKTEWSFNESLTADRNVSGLQETTEFFSLASDVVVTRTSVVDTVEFVDLAVSGMVRTTSGDYAAVWRWKAVLPSDSQSGELFRYAGWNENPVLDEPSASLILPAATANALAFDDVKGLQAVGFSSNVDGEKEARLLSVDNVGNMNTQTVSDDAFRDHLFMDVKIAGGRIAAVGYSEGFLGRPEAVPAEPAGTFPAALFVSVFDGNEVSFGASGPRVSGSFGFSRANSMLFNGNDLLLVGNTVPVDEMGELLQPVALTAWRYRYEDDSSFTRLGAKEGEGLLLPQIASATVANDLFQGQAAALVTRDEQVFVAGSLSILNEDTGVSEDPAAWELAFDTAAECGNGVVEASEKCDITIAAGQQGACADEAICATLDAADECKDVKLDGVGCEAECIYENTTSAPEGCIVDAGVALDGGSLCGNGTVDEADGETCDTALVEGETGVCPTQDDCMALDNTCFTFGVENTGCLAKCVESPVQDPPFECQNSDAGSSLSDGGIIDEGAQLDGGVSPDSGLVIDGGASLDGGSVDGGSVGGGTPQCVSAQDIGSICTPAANCATSSAARCTAIGECSCCAEGVVISGGMENMYMNEACINDVTFTDDAQYFSTQHWKVVAGDIKINRTGITTIDLPSLAYVEGKFSATSNTTLTSIRLGTLTLTTPSSFNISSNALLSSVNWHSLNCDILKVTSNQSVKTSDITSILSTTTSNSTAIENNGCDYAASVAGSDSCEAYGQTCTEISGDGHPHGGECQ
ncbi:MAG: carboxypeptidase-like regulatory domain-containing protein [Deltaproteobacteria bacterium]|nr:carboxypeptidase-like regulatory domain-containing protein [Deltaproteobacteria bacterium]